MKANYVLTVLLILALFSCNKDENFSDPINPDAESINEYIFGLNYDPEAMLNV